MRRCPEARALLPAFVEKELSSEEAARVTAHLAGCPACRREAERCQAALTPLHSDWVRQPIPAPRDLYAGFAVKLQASGALRQPTRRSPRLAWGIGLASLAAVAVVSAAPLARLLIADRPMSLESTLAIRRELARREAAAVEAHSRRNAAAPAIQQIQPENDPAQAGPAVSAQDGALAEGAAGPSAQQASEDLKPPPSRVARNHSPQRRVRRAPESFLDVQPERGLSAQEQFDERAPAAAHKNTPAPAIAATAQDDRHTVKPEGSDVVREPLVSVREERVQVGSSVTKVRTGYREDAQGRRSIEVNIGTFSGPGSAPDRPTNK